MLCVCMPTDPGPSARDVSRMQAHTWVRKTGKSTTRGTDRSASAHLREFYYKNNGLLVRVDRTDLGFFWVFYFISPNAILYDM